MELQLLPWWLPWLLAPAALLLLGAWLQRRLGRLGRVRAGRRHQRRGQAREADAARWLRQQGFRVLAEQPSAHYTLEVEGEPREVRMCADLRVHDGHEEWVVEVKTGQQGSRPGFRGTRRQLLEYQLAFGTRGVLLVDPVRQQLWRVRFPFAEGHVSASSSPRSIAWLLLSAAAAAVIWAVLEHIR